MNFFADLLRRRVYRTAAIYAAVAWGLTEALINIADQLGFPDWISTLIVIVFLVGFPVAIYLAWVFDITPEGIRRTETSSAQGRMSVVLSAVMLIVGTGLLFWLIYPGERVGDTIATTPEPVFLPADTIAVLPFVNATGDEDVDYYARGVAETLLAQLSQVTEIKVIARDSSFALPGGIDAKAKARRVKARYLLDGSVQRSSASLRIIARLIDGETGEYAWSDTYDGDAAEVFEIQDLISAAVINNLRPVIGVDTVAASERRITMSEPAYDQYLRGIFQFNIRTPEALDRAIVHFDAAIKADPEMSLAYVGRAVSKATLSGMDFFIGLAPTLDPIRNDWHDYLYPAEVRSSAQDLAQIVTADIRLAMDLGPGLAEVHTASGLLNLRMRRFGRAEANLARAIALNPSYSLAHHMLGLLYLEIDRFDEAVEQLNIALTLDPLSTTLHLDLAAALGVNAGNVERSIAQFETLQAVGDDYLWRDVRHPLMRLGRHSDWAARAFQGKEQLQPEWRIGSRRNILFWGFAYPRGLLGDIARYERINEEIHDSNDGPLPLYRDLQFIWTEQQIEEIGRQAIYKFEEQVASWWLFMHVPQTGEFERGLHKLTKVMASVPAGVRVSPMAYSYAGRYALALGDCNSAISYFELAARDLHPEDWPYSRNHIDWLYAYVDALDYAMALQCVGLSSRATDLINGTAEWLDRIEADGYWAPQAPVVRAKIHALRGEFDLALTLLESYADSPGPVLQGIRNDPVFAEIADNPRFIAVIEIIMADNAAILEEIDRLEAEFRARFPP